MVAQPMLLGDVVQFGNGKAIKPGGQGRYPVYGSNGVIGGSDEFRHENGIIIGRVGAYCGSVAYCPDRFWASDNTLVAFPASEHFDTKFLFYLLTEARLSQHAGGAAQPLVTQTVLKQVKVQVPSLPEQKRIAGVLSSYDDLIENNQRRIRILEEMARALYREWFVEFRFPCHAQGKLVSSALGRIPNGWKVGSLADFLSYDRRSTRPGTHLDGRKYVPIDCLPSKSLALVETRPIEEAQSSLQLFEAGEILFGAMRPYFHKVVIAPFAGVTRTTCFVLTPTDKCVRAFAALTVFDEGTVEYANAHSQGATIPYAVWEGSLKEMPVLVPTTSVLSQFEKLVAPILERISQSFFTLTNLRKTRDLLLPRLLGVRSLPHDLASG